MDVSVVVTTYNRPDVLAQCLAALRAQEAPGLSWEVLVVDDCSSDDTPRRLAEEAARWPGLRVLRQPTNRGQSAARNLGAARARGALLVFLDDDIIPEPGYVAAHAGLHRGAPDRVAGVGNLSFAASLRARSNLARYLDGRYLGRRGAPPPPADAALAPQYFGAGIASVSRADFDASGGFEEGIRLYGAEDMLLGRELVRIGVRIAFVEGAHAVHVDAVSLDRYRAKAREAARESVPVLLRAYPDFYDRSPFRFLMAPARGDPLGRRLAKRLARAALSDASVRLLEAWARRTDGAPHLFSAAAYHALLAGWFRQGLDAPPTARRQVAYQAVDPALAPDGGRPT